MVRLKIKPSSVESWKNNTLIWEAKFQLTALYFASNKIRLYQYLPNQYNPSCVKFFFYLGHLIFVHFNLPVAITLSIRNNGIIKLFITILS